MSQAGEDGPGHRSASGSSGQWSGSALQLPPARGRPQVEAARLSPAPGVREEGGEAGEEAGGAAGGDPVAAGVRHPPQGLTATVRCSEFGSSGDAEENVQS